MAVKVNKGQLPLLYIFPGLLAYGYGDLASNKALIKHHYDWQHIENNNITTSMKDSPTEKMGKNPMPLILQSMYLFKTLVLLLLVI